MVVCPLRLQLVAPPILPRDACIVGGAREEGHEEERNADAVPCSVLWAVLGEEGECGDNAATWRGEKGGSVGRSAASEGCGLTAPEPDLPGGTYCASMMSTDWGG